LTPAPFNPEDDLGLIDYYEALFEVPQVQIALEDGGSITLRAAGLGAAYYMEHLGQLIPEDPLEYRVGLFARWLRAAGVPDPTSLSLGDLVKVATAAKGLNRPTGRMAWDLIPMEEEKDPAYQPVDFTGRPLTRVIHALAQHYGWPIEQIINLPREVAMAHLQECVLADRREKEWAYSLSEVAWEYDKGAGVSRYRPLPDIPWEKGIPMRPREEDVIPAEAQAFNWPKGVIIDLQEEARKKRNGSDREKIADG
jgi:hypothetical protein